jgi:hypothetical protein
MNTINQLLICTILTGFMLILVGCADQLPPEPELIVTPEEKTLLEEIEGAGGEVDRDEDDNITMITLSTGGDDSNVTDAWIDKNIGSIKKQFKLEVLNLGGSQVTKKRLETLKKELPKVEVTFD